MESLPAPVQSGPHDGCRPGAGTIFPEHGGQIGNPSHEVTEENRQKVRLYTKVMTVEMVAAELGIGVSTLYKHYSEDLSAGKREVIATLGSKVISKARDGDNQMLMFWLKTWGGWNEPQPLRVEISGPGGGPIPVAHIHAHLMGKSDNELALITEFFAALAGPGGVAPGGDGADSGDSEGSGEDWEADSASAPDGGGPGA